MKLLEVKNLTVKYEKRLSSVTAVDSVDLSLNSGECIGIIGESGSGKTTVGKALMDLLPPNAVTSYDSRTPESGPNIALIFQNPMTCLNPSLTIGRQLIETIHLHSKLGHRKAKEEAMRLLDTTGIRDSASCLKSYPFQLSGGMQQRVVIAVALACNPALLIADEPTTALDMTVQKQILDLLRDIIRELDIAVLLITHDFGVAAALCDRIMVMKKSRVIEEGNANDIFRRPTNEYTKKLINDATLSLNRTKIPKHKKDLLSVVSVSKTFVQRYRNGKEKMIHAVRDMSFTVKKGESFGIVGESGSGKTTLARMITGIEVPSSGKIIHAKPYGEKDCTIRNPGIQLIFQDSLSSMHPYFTVSRIMEEPLLYNHDYNKEERSTKIETMLDLVGLKRDDMYKLPQMLSGGEQQRVAIGRALMGEPELLICDEAVSAIDVSIQSRILKLLKEIQVRNKLTYLFISHDLDVVRYISNRMGVIYGGLMVEIGNTDDIYEDPWHPYTKQLLTVTLTPDPIRTRRKPRIPLKEELPSANAGCPYYSHCGYALSYCRDKCPDTYSFNKREVRCFLYSRNHTNMRNKDYRMVSQI